MRTRHATVVAAALLALFGCSDDGSSSSADGERVTLSFDADDPFADDASLAIELATARGGDIKRGRSWNGSSALRFPTFSPDSPGVAVLSVRPAEGAADRFSPGADDFEFGVDFAMDPESEGGIDNGNNLIQRGLFEDGAQYKLQLDHGRLSCRVQGSEAGSLVKAREPLEAGTWYRARCVVHGGALALRVAELATRGPEGWTEVAGASDAGDVTFTADVPLSLGGKLSPEGTVVPDDSDQFNGLLDNFYFSIGPLQG